MGVEYKAITWTAQKKQYDQWVLALVSLVLVLFIGVSIWIHPQATKETLIIRSSGFAAFLVLHVILWIGPLSRIDKRFLPLLYNRRHLGVVMALLAMVHGIFSMIQFHALGDTHVLISIFTSNENYRSISQFPFQVLGFFALFIISLMAITSHDFWLKNLGSSVWKFVHMGVYLAYGLLVAHVALGSLQYETSDMYPIMLGVGFLVTCGLHTYSGWQSLYKQRIVKGPTNEEKMYSVGTFHRIPEGGAVTVRIEDQVIAIYRYDGKIAAVSNFCRHQMGPLGEGKIVDGCITCPWHGYQYYPHNGQSPPPYNEKLETYNTKVRDGQIWIDPRPNSPGMAVIPSVCPNVESDE